MKLLCLSSWYNIAQKHHILNVVQIHLREHYTRIKKITGAMLGQTTQSSFRRKITICNVVLICLCQHSTRKHENYLCNVDPKLMNNFAQENNVQCCLDLCGSTFHCERKVLPVQCWSMVNKQLFLAK